MNAFIDFEFNDKNIIVNGSRHKVLDMISIGVCTDNDQSFYAISNEFDVSYSMSNSWMRENVMCHIYNMYSLLTEHVFSELAIREIISNVGKSKKQIACDLYDFFNPHFKSYSSECITDVLKDVDEYPKKHFLHNEIGVKEYIPNKVNFFGWHCESDWLLICELYNNMGSIPVGFGYDMTNLKQSLIELSKSESDLEYLKSLLPENSKIHNALSDAIWNKKVFNIINNLRNERKR